MRQSSLESSELRSHFESEMTLTATVRTDPVKVKPAIFAGITAPPRYSFLAATQYGPIRVIAPSTSVVGLLPGQKISLRGEVLASKERRVAALVIADQELRVITPPSRWSQSLANIRDGLQKASGDGDAGALIPGMVLGDTRGQSAEFKETMRRAGLTHLVAVSGANFAIVSAFVLWCMQFIFRTIPARLWATAIALAAFIALVRPSPSVLRAAAMAAVALLAARTYQRRDSLPALGFAIAAVIAIDPWQARDAGFALSVLATGGLLLIAPVIVERLSKYMPEKVAGIIAPPLAAMLACLPIIVALSGFISPVSILANIFAAPFVAPITVVGFVAALISPFSPELAHLLLLLVRPLASAITTIAHQSGRFPVLTLSQGLVGSVVVLTAIAIVILLRKKGVLLILLILIATTWWARFPAHEWQVYSCDVGQGDATVINLHHNSAIVIDVGPDPLLIDQCLRELHIKRISLLILTHPHADHVAGLTGAQKNRTIDVTWYGNIAAGSRAHIGEYTIDVLWPQRAGFDDPNPNNVSIAARISSPDLTLFAAGDIEPPVQEQLRGKVGKVDIYKVAHHGSRFQDPVLMRELAPTLAMISVGEGNTYGHPAASTIAELEALHAKVLRTDIHGAIAVSAERHRISFEYEAARARLIGFR